MGPPAYRGSQAALMSVVCRAPECGVGPPYRLVGGVFAAFEGVEAAEHVDAFAVVEMPELVGGHQFAAEPAVVGGGRSRAAFAFAVVFGVDGGFAEAFADPFGGGLLVASQEQDLSLIHI